MVVNGISGDLTLEELVDVFETVNENFTDLLINRVVFDKLKSHQNILMFVLYRLRDRNNLS